MIDRIEQGRFKKRAGGSEISTPSMLNLQTQIDRRTLVRDTYRNLVIKNNVTNPAYQLDVTVDEVVLQDGDGEPIKAMNVSELVDVAVSGVGGLDTGTEAADTWYYIWLISNGSEVDTLLSTSSTAPTMPSGYTYKALVGTIYNDSGSNFIKIYQQDNHVGIERVEVLTAGTAVTPTSISLASIVPLTAKSILGDVHQNTSSAQTAYVGYYDTVLSIWDYQHVWFKAGAMSNHNSGGFESFLRNSEIFYYVSLGNMNLNVTGWKY